MTTTMTGVNGGTFNNLVAAPVDGELVTGSSVQLVAQGAANQDKHIYDLLKGTGTAARSQWPVEPSEWDVIATGEGEGETGGWSTTVNTITSFFSEFTDIPDGVKLTSSTIYVHPAGGHGGLPGNMPSLRLTLFDVTTGTRTDLGTATDSSGSVGAYQARHSITRTFAAPTAYNRAIHRVIAVVVAEYGANALSGFRVGGATIAWNPA